MRSAVVDPIVSLLRAGQSVALVGPVGVGKRSLALSLHRSDAWSDEIQPTLSFDVPMVHPQSWPVYCTTTRHWIAGSFYVGNLENRVDMMLRRVKKPAIVLFESVHTAMGAWQGRGDNLDLVDLLVSVVTHPRLRMVVTATPDGWAQIRERKPDFAAQFVVVETPAPSDSESRVIAALELAHRGVDVPTADAAIAEAFALADRHFGAEPPLGPALRLLRGALSAPGGGVGLSAIRGACAAHLGMERRWVGRDLVPSAASILSRLEKTVLGQHEACGAVVDDLIAWLYGLASPGRAPTSSPGLPVSVRRASPAPCRTCSAVRAANRCASTAPSSWRPATRFACSPPTNPTRSWWGSWSIRAPWSSSTRSTGRIRS